MKCLWCWHLWGVKDVCVLFCMMRLGDEKEVCVREGRKWTYQGREGASAEPAKKAKTGNNLTSVSLLMMPIMQIIIFWQLYNSIRYQSISSRAQTSSGSVGAFWRGYVGGRVNGSASIRKTCEAVRGMWGEVFADTCSILISGREAQYSYAYTMVNI